MTPDIAQLERWHRQARDAGLVDLTVYLAREIERRREMAAESEEEER